MAQVRETLARPGCGQSNLEGWPLALLGVIARGSQSSGKHAIKGLLGEVADDPRPVHGEPVRPGRCRASPSLSGPCSASWRDHSSRACFNVGDSPSGRSNCRVSKSARRLSSLAGAGGLESPSAGPEQCLLEAGPGRLWLGWKLTHAKVWWRLPAFPRRSEPSAGPSSCS